MSRGDIANYLRLAAETVSRVLSRFRSQQLIEIEGRELELLIRRSCARSGRRCCRMSAAEHWGADADQCPCGC